MNELAKLRQLITNHFSTHELIIVLNDLGIDHENFGERGLSGLALASVQYFERHTGIPEFAKALARRRPTVDFSHWGAPLPKEDLHGVLRQLLDVAFSTSDISSLTFDVLPKLYGEVQSSRSKARSIEIVVEATIQNNAVLELMEWVRVRNNYQYGAYFSRVDAALTAHQHKEPEYAPSVPLTSEKPLPKQNVNGAIVLALKMYANGLQDDGVLAKEALRLAGY